MKYNKSIQVLNFERNRPTNIDPLSNSVILSTSLSLRDTSQDAYANYVVLNLRMDTPVRNTTIFDDVGNPYTRSGTTTPYVTNTPTSILRNENSVAYFAAGDFLKFTDSKLFDLGASDFTMECWFKTTTVGSGALQSLIVKSSGASYGPFLFVITTLNRLGFYVSNRAATAWQFVLTGMTQIEINTWYHAAIVRSGDIFTLYLNGVADGVYNNSVPGYVIPYSSSYTLSIGTDNGGAKQFDGYLDDIRITVGVARYLTNFTPPDNIPAITTAQLLKDDILTEMSNTGTYGGVDLQMTAGPFADPCMYFDGASYLAMPYNKQNDFFAGDTPFTVDLWFKIDKNGPVDGSSQRNEALIEFGYPASSTRTNAFQFAVYGTSAVTGTGFQLINWNSSSTLVNVFWPVKISKGVWHHVALCRETGLSILKLYFNGKFIQQTQDVIKNSSIYFNPSNNMKIGSLQYASYNQYFLGWMSDLRITKDCRYFGDFTPPTATFNTGDEVLSETSLLMHFNDTGLDPVLGLTNEVRYNHTVTAYGEATLSAKSKFGNTSAYFPGSSSSSLKVTYASILDISTSDFTIEFWFSPLDVTTTSTHRLIFDCRSNASYSRGILIGQPAATPNRLYAQFADSAPTTAYAWKAALLSNTVLSVGSWYHVAIVRTGSLFAMFINGNFEASAVWSGTLDIVSNDIYLGIARETVTAPYYGYLDELRISNWCIATSVASKPDVSKLGEILLMNFEGTNGSQTLVDESVYQTKSIVVGGNTNIVTSKYKFGSSSVYFDGTGDYFTTAMPNNVFNGDFTIEFWVWPVSASCILFSDGTNQNYYYPGNNIYFNGTATIALPSLTTSQWTHIAITRTQTILKVFINGTQTGANYYLGAAVPLSTFDFGRYAINNNLYYTGYLDGLRINNGVSYYSANFTPPAVAPAIDSDWASVSAMIPFDGTSIQTVFVDAKNHTITAGGDAYISALSKKFGTGSGCFDGSGDYAYINDSGDDFYLDGDFTIEAWIKAIGFASATGTIFNTRRNNGSTNTPVGLSVTSAGKLQLQASDINSGAYPLTLTGSTTLSSNVWYHVAATRTGNVWRIFVNGALDGSTTLPVTIYNRTGGYQSNIGGDSNTNYFTGFIDELRVTRGVSRYTGNFVAPTSAFPETVQDDQYYNSVTLLMHFNLYNNSIVDLKSHALTIDNMSLSSTARWGSSSAQFNGVGSVSMATSADFGMGTGDFTVECWFNAAYSPANNTYILDIPNTCSVYILTATSDFIRADVGGHIFTSTIPITFNSWHHVAVVRNGYIIYFFYDGVLIGSKDGQVYFPDVKGHTLTPYVNAQISTAQSKFGGASAYFDGSSYITTPDSSDFVFGTGDFTIEFQIKTSQSNDGAILDRADQTVNTWQVHIGYGCIQILDNVWHTISDPINDNNWHHIAIVRTDGFLKCYVDGVYSGGYSNSSDYSGSISQLTIGRFYNQNNPAYYFTGYLDEIRITKGVARYTSTFTPPTAAFPETVQDDQYYNSVTLLTHFNTFLDSGASNPVYIGSNSSGTNSLYGYIDSVRITKAVARYVAAFGNSPITVPSAPFANDTSDAYWANYTALLMHFDEMNQFVDDAGHVFTPKGNVAISSTQSKFGGYSAHFRGIAPLDGFLLTPHKDDLHLSGDFTIEGWIRPQRVTGDQWILNKGGISGTNYSSYLIKMDDTAIKFTSYSSDAGGGTLITLTTFGTVAVDTWYHFAIVRFGNTWQGYLDGVQGFSTVQAGTPYNQTSNGLSLGGDCSGTRAKCFAGFLDEVRITKGYARYTAAFTAPTVPFTYSGMGDIVGMSNPGLHLRGNGVGTAIVDERGHALTLAGNTTLSSTQSKFGGSSIYFDGNGDYINCGDNADLEFGSGDFTIECWAMLTGYSSGFSGFYASVLVGKDASGTRAFHWRLVGTASSWTDMVWSTAGTELSVSFSPNLNTWYHLAVCKSGTTLRFFVDGAQQGTDQVHNSSISDVSTALTIGGILYTSWEYYFPGYMDEVRITKGYARYTTAFTAPTTQFPIYANDPYFDKLLLAVHFKGTSGSTLHYDTGPHAVTLTNINSVSLSTTQKRFPPTAGYFVSASSTGLSFPTPLSFNFQEDWTFECWVWFATDAPSPYQAIIDFDGSTGAHSGHFIGKNVTTNTIFCSLPKQSAATTWMTTTSSGAISLTAWHHIAVTKRGMNVKIFIDGINDGSSTLVEQPRFPTGTNTSYIGRYHDGTCYLNGYLSDVRLTQTCKWTANFTPPQMMYADFPYAPILQTTFEGTDDSTTFIDNVGHILTAAGSAVISTDDKKFGSSSAYFTGGATDAIVVGNGLGDFAYNDGDFNIECWVKTTNNAGGVKTVYRQDHSSYQVWIYFGDSGTGHKLSVCVGDTTKDTIILNLTKTNFSSSFRHILVSKKETYYTVFVDGVYQGKGIISSMIPPKAILLLLHGEGSDNGTTMTDSSQYNRTITRNGNTVTKTGQKKIGSSSIYFDGTGDYLTVPKNLDWDLGAQDFTIECWVYLTAYNANVSSIFSLSSTNSPFYGIRLGIGTAAQGATVRFALGTENVGNTVGGAVQNTAGTTSISLNTWYHVAAVRSGNKAMIFVNGTKDAEGDVFGNVPYYSGDVVCIATDPAFGGVAYDNKPTGYFDELCVTKGYAKYVSNFTAPLTAFAVTDTFILSTPTSVKIGGDGTNGFEGYIDDLRVIKGNIPYQRTLTLPAQENPALLAEFNNESTQKSDIVSSKGVYLSPIAKKFGNTSAFFPGGSSGTSYLRARMNSEEGQLYYGDWTIEFWIMKLDYTPTARALFTFGRTSGTYCPLMMVITNTGSVNALGSTTASNWDINLDSGAFSINVWHHVAFTRKSGIARLFLDGSLKASSNFTSNNIITTLPSITVNHYYIGYDYNSPDFFGFIDGFNFVVGFAKYWKNFQVPSVPLSQSRLDYYDVNVYGENTPLIAYYRLNDTTTTIEDSYKNYDLTLSNINNVQQNQESLVAFNSDIDLCTKFLGSGTATGSFYNFAGLTAFTINLFIKTSASSGTILYKQSTFIVEIVNGKINFGVTFTNGTVYLLSNASINDNTTHQVSLSCVNSALSIFIDGQNDAILSSTPQIDYKTGELAMSSTSSDVMLQMRCNNEKDDLKNSVFVCGGLINIANDSPFNTQSIFFDNSFHIEVNNFTFSEQKLLTQPLMGMMDCTIEFWMKVVETPANYTPIIYSGCPVSGTGTSNMRGGFGFDISSSLKLRIYAGNASVNGASGSFRKETANAFSLNTWYHVAIVCYNNSITVYSNGVAQTLAFIDFANSPHNTLANCQVYTTDRLNIGSFNYNYNSLGAGSTSQVTSSGLLLDDIRITRGRVYTTNFTPPASEFAAVSNSRLLSSDTYSNEFFGSPIVCEGPRKINKKVLSFNGTTDYLFIVDPLLNGTFTFDCWIWVRTISNSEQTIVSQISGSDNANTSFGIKNKVLQIFNGSVGEVLGSTELSVRTWYHVAFVRNGTSCKAYLNGVLEATQSSFQEPIRVSSQIAARDGAAFFNGLIDAVRVRTEESWTDAFTPPTRSSYIADDYFDDVALLLRGDSISTDVDSLASKVGMQLRFHGYNNSVIVGSYDDVFNNGITVVGNAKFANGHFKNLKSSIAFNGIGDALTITNHSSIALGTTFTLEFWIYIVDFTVKRTLFDKRTASNSGFLVYLDTDSKMYVKGGDSDNAAFEVTATSAAITVGWRHIAIVRNASDTNSWKIFVDGTQSGSTANSSVVLADSTDLIIGKTGSSTEYFKGQLSEVILTQNTAKYTTNFTAPTAPALNPIAVENDYTSLLLHFDGADSTYSFTDSSRYGHVVNCSLGAKISTTQSKFGSSSLYLSGTAGSGVIVAPHEVLNLGEGDFTIDFWFRANTVSTVYNIVSTWAGAGYGPYWAVVLTATNRIAFYWYPYAATPAMMTGATTTIAATTWYHVAVTRKREVFYLWINGALEITFNTSKQYAGNKLSKTDQHLPIGLTIGDVYDATIKYGSSTADFPGYIDEVRVVRGVALYTEPFTAPASAYSLSGTYPVRNSNVTLFLDVDDSTDSSTAILEKSSWRNVITKEGGITSGTVIGGSAATFDGAGDAICMTTCGDVATLTDNFCIDLWVNPTTGGKNAQDWGRIIETEVYPTTGGWNLVVDSTINPTKPFMHDSKTGGMELLLGTIDTVPNSTWSHLAFTREGNFFTSWVNGAPKSKTLSESTIDPDNKGGWTLSNSNKTGTLVSSTSFLSKPLFNSQSSQGIYIELGTGGTIANSLVMMGVFLASAWTSAQYPGQVVTSWGVRGSDGYKGTGATWASYGSAYASGDVVMIAVKNGKIWFGKNGTWFASGNPYTEANPAYSNLTGMVGVSCWSSNVNTAFTLRTYAGGYSYAPPKGFLSLREGTALSFTKKNVSIGAGNDSANSFYGSIDDVRFTRGDTRYSLSWSERVLAGDANSASVMLLLNCNGADGGTTFTDSSNSGKTVTVGGTVTTVTAVKRFGSASAYFNGTTGYLSLADSADWNLGTGDFTIETWFNLEYVPIGVYGGSTAQYLFNQRLDSNNYIAFILSGTGATFEVRASSSTLITLSATFCHDQTSWHHIALTRSGNVFTIWYDGILFATSTVSMTMPDINAALEIGRGSAGTAYFKGWMDDIRITKGVCRYPAEFNYPALQRPLQPLPKKFRAFNDNIPSFFNTTTISNPTSKFDIGINCNPFSTNTGSYYAAVSANFGLVANRFDFTIEGWFKPTATGTRNWLLHGYDTNGGISLRLSTNTMVMRWFTTDLTATVSISDWAHCVWQRRGNHRMLFVNGVLIADDNTVNSDLDVWDVTTEIGACTTASGDSGRYYGLIDGVRWTRGVARYSTNIATPSTAFPETLQDDQYYNSVTLLTHFNGANNSTTFTDVKEHTVTPNGNAKISTTQSRFGGASAYFDGDGDYLQISSSSDFDFGSGDFTIECWVYSNSANADSCALVGKSGSSKYSWMIYKNASSNTFSVYISTNGTTWDLVNGGTSDGNTAASAITSSWKHIALVRSGTSFYFYDNGILDTMWSARSGAIYSGSGDVFIGSDYTPSAYFSGYIDELRITKGVARYLPNFTPPTLQFPEKYNSFANTSFLLHPEKLNKLPQNVRRLGDPSIVRTSGIDNEGSIWFNGSFDYITLNPASAIFSEDFTIEFWMEAHALGTVTSPIIVWSQAQSLADAGRAQIRIVSDILQFQYGATTYNLDTFSIYTWTHIALTRAGGILRVFVNGFNRLEITLATFAGGVPTLGLAVDDTVSSAENFFRGFLKNFRILKNVVLYTTNFTPSLTLSVQLENNINKIVDPGFNLEMGDFEGTLDEVSFSPAAVSESFVKNNYLEGEVITPATPRVNSDLKDSYKKIKKNIDGHYGTGKIWGTLLDKYNNPLKRRILLIENGSYFPLEETWSDQTTGYYEFNLLDKNSLFTIIAVDFDDYHFNDIIRSKCRAT